MTGPSRPNTIFVSVAAYRDPDLVLTITDCLAKARDPDRLRFGICWQYGPEEMGSMQLAGPQFAVHYVDQRLSKGACWARAEIMKLYDGEDWYLQLDSHHRFTQDWDAKLIEQAACTGVERPILSTYAAGFKPGEEAAATALVTSMEVDHFTAEGLLLPKPGIISESRSTPLRARFVSAHFLFAPGSFVRDVPYDPDLYFLGEEITLAVRAFTHGYDLFHPACHILWHEYTRANRVKHWDDHTHERGATVAWHERDAVSLAKVSRFLTEPWTGPDGAGTVRSVADYEAYAGVSFRHRRVQDYTRQNREPPNPVAAPHWPERVKNHKVEIQIQRAQLPPAAISDPSFWYVGVHDHARKEIYRDDAGPAELRKVLANGHDVISLVREFSSERIPASWTVMPCSISQGWLEPVSGPIGDNPRIFVSIASYRDPDLVPTISDCLAKARHPNRLRFVICWQHGPEEQLPDWIREPQFCVLGVDYRESRGSCWARAAIMKEWAGEEWFLQIDSHQRFAQDWDTTLLREAALTGSAKPLLSAPAPGFTIGAPLPHSQPLRIELSGFRANGIPKMKTGFLPPDAAQHGPVRARSVCGHLLFAPGDFARQVPYDPEMYFSSEETTMAVRAFTHGFDLFHPTAVVTWHEYTRAYRTKHWDDHSLKQGAEVPWHRLHQEGVARVARFFNSPSVGEFGLGQERTFADYEAYAGISFRHRRMQDYTRLNKEPPNPPADPDWPEHVRDHRIEITLDVSQLPEEAKTLPVLWYIGIHDANGHEFYRQDASKSEVADLLATGGDRITLVREFASSMVPASWTVMPLSRSAGWLEHITHKIRLDTAGNSSSPTKLRVLTSDAHRVYQKVIFDGIAGRISKALLSPSLARDSSALAAAISEADVFHLHWPELFLGPDIESHETVIAALERADVPVVWTQHNLVPHNRDPHMAAIYKRWANVARGVIHHSKWGEQRVRERYRFRGDAVHRVIPHPHFGPLVGDDARTRPQIETALGLRHGVLRLAVIGAPRRERDTELVMRAVTASNRRDVELTVYSLRPGETGLPDDRVIARTYEMVPRDLYDSRLRVADALVMPFQPGDMLTTGTIGDAIAHGLPCLVSEWPFLRETLGRAGIPYGHTAEDLAGLIDTLTDEILAEAGSAAAALRAQTAPSLVGRMTLALFRDLTERHSAS
jgi:glycosyltransferase involved in cell wall biosynthesis